MNTNDDIKAIVLVLMLLLMSAVVGFLNGRHGGYRAGVATGLRGELHHAGSGAFYIKRGNEKIWFED
jgi:hypothetical protein